MSSECHADPLRVAAYSTCPSGLWHERVAPLLAASDMVMLNIGANKGFNVVEFLQRYSTTPANLTHARWYTLLMEHGCAAQCCGVCGLCRASRIKQQGNARAHVHAFELQPANVRLLQTLVGLAGLPVTVHSTAVSNVSGVVYTANDVKPGAESFGIRHEGGGRRANDRRFLQRPVTTVDAFMTAFNVPRAQFVSIDTEGEDALVLRGMERMLREKRIDVIEFEYNRKWKAVFRDPRPLAPVVEWLYRLDYVCFWQGNKGELAQMSGSCYREETRNRFGFARSNAVCTHRADVIAVFRTCQRRPLCQA